MQFFQKKIKTLEKELGTNIELGLKKSQVKKKQKEYGLNILVHENKINPWRVFFDQFKSFLILILIIAAGISFFVGEAIDAIVIMLIVVLNSVLGFVQEYRAEKSIESLKKMASSKSRVLRNGKEILIDSKELVVGDIIFFEAGDKIGADARIIQAVSLETAEAALTGESLPVDKNTDLIKKDVVIGDQKNMVFATTVVTKGRGKAIVTSIGMDTQIGKIAGMIQEAPEKETNLQKDLDKLSKWLGAVVLIICVLIFLTNVIFGQNGLQEAFLIAIALSVAAIPEGLPAVVTISLGLGVKRLVKKNALMRKLSSVETLGSVDVICTDKTGTLTKNEMTVKKLFVNNQEIGVDGVGYKIEGGFSVDAKNYLELLKIGLLCNNSDLDGNNIIGDPTEVALLVSAMKAGLDRKKEENLLEWYDEIPFDSDRKMMSSIYSFKSPLLDKSVESFPLIKGDTSILFSKGAPEVVLKKCDRILINGKIKKLTQKDKKRILDKNNEFAKDALRVLGFAYKNVAALKSGNVETLEEDLVFVGLQAMIDPPRKEVKDAIVQCKKAGIKVVMITGDNIVTAKAIASELGISGEAMEGISLEKLNDSEIENLVKSVGVFARVSPRHKQKIVKALKKHGHVVAMTGDGVNDAPALKYADIGLAMGITGTDVTKEAGDMILLDDNFATIVKAIEEGRGIYDNIKKFVSYLLSTNFAEILIIFISVLIGLPVPLIAIQILWINLVTDGFPALALGVDPANPNIMSKRPRKSGVKIVDKKMLINIVTLSLAMTIGSIYVFVKNYHIDLDQARTGVFVLLTLLEMLRIWMIRDDYEVPFWSNKWLFGAVGLSVGLVMLVVYIPFLAQIFQTVPLSGEIWMQIGIVLFALILMGVLLKKLKYLHKKRK
ncbi:MAG TPA: calcium-translocating P-type ATPase, PMCA-type [Candidatus Absconditabacterales bacterium]|nr:calcium-translocating P-type ATPase, PMCA-type [Candidatus Absconditabacterales bacterium]